MSRAPRVAATRPQPPPHFARSRTLQRLRARRACTCAAARRGINISAVPLPLGKHDARGAARRSLPRCTFTEATNNAFSSSCQRHIKPLRPADRRVHLALFLSGVNVALATRVTLARPRSRGSRHRAAAALPPRRTRRRPRRRAVRGGAVRLGGRGAVVCGPRNSRRLLSTRQGFGLCLMALPIDTLTQVIPQDGAINLEWVPCSAKAIERQVSDSDVALFSGRFGARGGSSCALRRVQRRFAAAALQLTAAVGAVRRGAGAAE